MSKSILVIAWMAAAGYVIGTTDSTVSVNGHLLSPQEVLMLQASLGVDVRDGNYRLDSGGCWVDLDTGATGCLRESSGAPELADRGCR